MLRAIPPRIKHTTTIIVAPSRRSARPAQHREHVQHLLKPANVFWRKWHAVQRGQHAGMQKEVQRVYMVISGLFEIKPIQPYLPLRFPQHNFPSPPLPTRRGVQLGAKRSDGE